MVGNMVGPEGKDPDQHLFEILKNQYGDGGGGGHGVLTDLGDVSHLIEADSTVPSLSPEHMISMVLLPPTVPMLPPTVPQEFLVPMMQPVVPQELMNLLRILYLLKQSSQKPPKPPKPPRMTTRPRNVNPGRRQNVQQSTFVRDARRSWDPTTPFDVIVAAASIFNDKRSFWTDSSGYNRNPDSGIRQELRVREMLEIR